MKTRNNKRSLRESDQPNPSVPAIRAKRKSKKPVVASSVSISPTSSDESSFSLPSMPSSGSPPKHKRPKQSAPPSSSPLVSSFLDVPKNFFRGNNFESRFKTNIIHKQYVYEKSLDKFYYLNSPVKNLFESCGLSSMVFPPSAAYPRLVQQFYTNLENNGDNFTSFVKGKSLFFTVVDLGSILSIPSTGVLPYTLKGAAHTPISPLEQLHIVMNDPMISKLYTPKTIDVSPLACVLHKLVRYNLLPRLGGGATFTYQDLVLVAVLMKGMTFNFSLMMVRHMMSCVRQSKTCLPYSGCLTKLFQHFKISLDNEVSVSLNESIDSVNLKSSRVSLIDGQFVRIPTEIPLPAPHKNPSSSTSTSPDIESLLHKISSSLETVLDNQHGLQNAISDISHRLTILEKGKVPMGAGDVGDMHKMYKLVEDEFIDLQAGFELHTTAMVAALERKMNRNACQLSQEVKFVSNQVGVLANFAAGRFNALTHTRMSSTVPEWPECNWMAEYAGDFLDMETPPATFIPRPPRFAHELSTEERIHRTTHRRYFTRRHASTARVEELD